MTEINYSVLNIYDELMFKYQMRQRKFQDIVFLLYFVFSFN